MSEYNLQMLRRNCGHGDMLEQNLVNCGTNPGIVSCRGMRQKGNLMEFVVTVNK